MKTLTSLIAKIIILFALITIILLPVCVAQLRVNSKIIDSGMLRLDESTNILAVGDSHAETSINPSLLPNSENISCSAENYFWTYYKIKHFIKHNKKITTVILPFSWHNLPKKYQEKFLFDKSFGKIDDYFLLLDENGRNVIETFDGSYLITWLKYTGGVPFQFYLNNTLLRELFGSSVDKKGINFYGGFKKISKNDLSHGKILKKVNSYFYHDSHNVSDSSTIMIEYLHKITQLCYENNIQLILLNAPVHKRYKSMIPAKAVASFEITKKIILTKYRNICYVDFSDMEMPDSCFSDGDHVNSSGAEIVTKALLHSISRCTSAYGIAP